MNGFKNLPSTYGLIDNGATPQENTFVNANDIIVFNGDFDNLNKLNYQNKFADNLNKAYL
jgi:hypothetical protein